MFKNNKILIIIIKNSVSLHKQRNSKINLWHPSTASANSFQKLILRISKSMKFTFILYSNNKNFYCSLKEAHFCWLIFLNICNATENFHWYLYICSFVIILLLQFCNISWNHPVTQYSKFDKITNIVYIIKCLSPKGRKEVKSWKICWNC